MAEVSNTSNGAAVTIPDSGFSARPVDREFFKRELDSFVPDKVFDAHAHVSLPGDTTFPETPVTIGIREYIRLADDLHPGRR